MQKAGSACQPAVVAAPAAMPEPGRPDPLLVSHQFVPPAATAAQLGRLTRGGRLAAAVADLQRYRGNGYVGHVVQAMRHDRLVSSPDDPSERTADRVAAQVMSPASGSAAGGFPGQATIQRPVGGPGGRAVPERVREPLERSLGSDFSAVRVHTDASADRLARALGAVAFTTGQHIFFRRGHYAPDGQPGRRLLAHELSHVVQQRSIASPVIQRKMGLEYEVDDIHTRHTNYWGLSPVKFWVPHNAGDFMMARTDYDLTADIATGAQQPYSRLEFRTRAFDETKQADVANMATAVNSIRGDIQAIRLATRANMTGYGAGNKWVGGGRQGWFAGQGWVGLDKIPRFRGPWYQQVNYAGSLAKDATGSLQLTAGLDLRALQRLLSGEQLGSLAAWPQAAQQDWRQYLHGYAREGQAPPRLYQEAHGAVRVYRLNRGGGRGSEGRMAAILTVMAQVPLSQRGATFEAGKMLAKTDYAKIISMARDSGMEFTRYELLHALLDVVNAHLQGPPVGPNDPVIPHAGPPDLTKVSFQRWVNTLMPRPRRGVTQPPADLMTRASYPGTQPEKAALRAFGPYQYTDPGERAIFELRSIMNNPSEDLAALVSALVNLMHALHHVGG
ncbi:MAG: DUF4157 domain-containing protein [Streptosporangiaceae bacterium]